MATRLENDAHREAMTQALRTACAQGRLSPGEMLPPVRELAETHQLSIKMAWQVLKTLVDEGLFYAVDRVGTFVNEPKFDAGAFLLTFPYNPRWNALFGQIQSGFERKIAQVGGVSLRLVDAEAHVYRQNGQLPPLAGVFAMNLDDSSHWPDELPRVEFGQVGSEGGLADKIRFDDVAGGLRATRHLLSLGHKRIAYVGLHTVDLRPNSFFWSVEREMGWAQAMNGAGISTEGLAFHPSPSAEVSFERALVPPEQVAVARQLALREVVWRRDITAILASNAIVAVQIFEALVETKIPPVHWPAVVCFDDTIDDAPAVLSYMRLPWEEVGATAAQLLWERTTGRLSGPPQQRCLTMQLIPRLTCREVGGGANLASESDHPAHHFMKFGAPVKAL